MMGFSASRGATIGKMANLKVKELIDALSRLDPDAEVEIELVQFNKRYPVAYLVLEKPMECAALPPCAYQVTKDMRARITARLPQNMRTSILKRYNGNADARTK